MSQKTSQARTPRARNNAAHTSLQNYFDRISNSLEDRIDEFLQMKKYARVYGESQKLLEIEKTINIASGSIFEINLENKLDCQLINTSMQLLNSKNTSIKNFIQGKPASSQLQLLLEVSKNLQKIVIHSLQITRNVTRINDVVPIIKILLKKKDKEGSIENDPLLQDISEALRVSVDQPGLTVIKKTLQNQQVNLDQYDSRLNFEHLNDVSDKLIGLLNDKLLLVIGVSETLIAGVEDDGTNDVDANQRLPDELRVLFLASSTLDVFHKIKEIRSCIKVIFNCIKIYLKIIESGKLGVKIEGILKNNSQNDVNTLVLNSVKNLKRLTPIISEIATSLDALDLKLKLNTLDLDKIIRMTYGLIFEKSNRTWENPYDT